MGKQKKKKEASWFLYSTPNYLQRGEKKATVNRKNHALWDLKKKKEDAVFFLCVCDVAKE